MNTSPHSKAAWHALAKGLLDVDWYAQSAGVAGSTPELVDHFLSHGLPAGRGFDARSDSLLAGGDPALVAAAAEVVRASPMFDADFYLRDNPDVARSRVDPAAHFVGYGWSEFRNPSVIFDVWWYQTVHLPHAGGRVDRKSVV